jgi:hypothetical protein
VEGKRADPTHRRLEVFLNTHKIEKQLVSETHFMVRNSVKISTCTTHTTSLLDGRAHADSAIIIRKYIKHHELPKSEMEYI